MASRYGRKGNFSPDDRKLMEDNMLSDDSDEKDPPVEKSVSKRRTSTSTVPTAKKTAAKANTVNEIVGSPWNGEGCKVCHKDSDHPNLLLCENCK